MVLAAVLALTGGLAAWPLQTVTVRLPRENDRLLAIVRVALEDSVSLVYRHSVELITVKGRFRVSRNAELLAVETRMESVGTGLPTTAVGRTRREDGWLVVDEGAKPIDALRFFMVPINQTKLTIADRAVDLTPLASGALIQIKVESMRGWAWLWYGVMRGWGNRTSNPPEAGKHLSASG